MELFFDLVISAVSIAVVVQYAWALRAHFSSKTVPDGTKLITVTVVVTTLVYTGLVWLVTQPLWAQLTGLVIELLSLALFWAAISASRQARLRLAFDAENPDSLVSEGPYRFIRHPFYTSYLIFWIGWAIATWSAWALLPLAALVAIYVAAARGEEQKFARSPLAQKYAEYRTRTGFFWPRLTSG
jgi:protein-S-isoprenylcysteine O-methyltransferase Ste14